MSLRAQQESTSSQYMLNPLSVNPAYAGYYNALSTSFMYRFQNIGIEGSPETQTFTIHSPLKQRYFNVGLQVMNQSIATSRQLGALVSSAYRLKLESISISVGLQGGIRMSESDLTSLTTQQQNDPVFGEDVRSLTPSFGAGVFLHNELMYVGISVPEISEFSNTNEIVTNRPLIIMGGYVFDVTRDIKFKPSGLVRMVDFNIVEFNVNASFIFKDVLVAGLGYRPNNAIIGLVQFFITDQLQFGYTYDAIINELAPVTSGSHEFGLQYIFRFSRKRVISPRYF